MRRVIKAAQLVLPLLLLSGCAFINSFNSDLDKQVDIWMSQHEYAKILDTLKYIRPSNPNYELLQKKRRQAIVAAKRYERTQITRALNLIEKDQWHQADLTLTHAMDKLPDNQALRKTYREFIAQRKQYLNSLYKQLTINKAEWLVKNKPVEEQLQRTLPDDYSTHQNTQAYKLDSLQVRQKLLDCGAQSENEGELELARHCYQLADKLQPDHELKQKLARIRAQLEQQQQPSQKSAGQAPTLSILGRNLLQKSKQALQAGNLKLALRHYEKIPDEDKQLPEVRSYDTAMQQRIHENVKQGIELGRKLYSQGQVEQALAVWNKLRELDPDNENLLSHIDRAERVRDKIKQLRKEQTPGAGIQPDSSEK